MVRRRSSRLDPLHVAEVRLGRAPQDPLQTAVVLEAWAGRTQVEALPEARSLRPAPVTELPRPPRRTDADHSVDVNEFLILLAILASAFGWIRPLERILDQGLDEVIVWALPLALGLDRALRLRYLSVDTLRALSDELPRLNLAIAALIGVVSFISTPVLVGLCLTVIWGEAAVFVRRGWAWMYVLLIGGTSLWFMIGGDELVALVTCTAAVAVITNICALGAEGERPVLEPLSLTFASALIGVSAGVMITSDLDMWIGTDVPTAASVLFVSLTGWWASARLATIWSELPDQLQRVRLRDRQGWTGVLVGGPVVEAVLRLTAPTTAILIVYAVLGEWRTVGVVSGFAVLALAMLLTGLVTSARYWAQAAAMFVAGAVVSLVLPAWWPGSTLLIGAAIPAIGAAIASARMLRHTTAVYATRMMIR